MKRAMTTEEMQDAVRARVLAEFRAAGFLVEWADPDEEQAQGWPGPEGCLDTPGGWLRVRAGADFDAEQLKACLARTEWEHVRAKEPGERTADFVKLPEDKFRLLVAIDLALRTTPELMYLWQKAGVPVDLNVRTQVFESLAERNEREAREDREAETQRVLDSFPDQARRLDLVGGWFPR